MSDKNELPTKEELAETQVLLKELRETVESKDAETAQAKEREEKLQARLDELEEKNQELTKKWAEDKKSAEETSERFKELEAKLARMPGKSAEYAEKSNELKAYEMFLVKGDEKMYKADAEEVKYLRTDNDREGGYLAPPEYVQEIIKNITEISPVRQVARVRTTSRSEIQVPRRTNKPLGGWFGEGGDIDESNQTYALEQIRAHNLGVIVIVTNQMLTDAAFNIESEINQDVAEFFAEFEGDAFINGDGRDRPQGLLADTRVQDVASGIANDLDADSFFTVQGELKAGYTGAWMLNRRTIARVRKLKGTNGQYLFAPAANGMPATIGGDPFFSAINMPDIAPGAKAVQYGDYMRAYSIVDGVSMATIRDPFSQAGQGKVRFIFHRRVGGKVLLPEALKNMVIST